MKSRNRILLHVDGADEVKPTRWLQKNLQKNEQRQYVWLLAQPMLAAERASRFHYSGSAQTSTLKPLQRFFGLLKPEASDIRTIIVFSVIIGLLSLTLPLAVEAVVNTIAFGRYLQPLVVLSLIVMTFLGFRAALSILMTVVTEVIQRKLFVRTVEDLSYRLTRVPLSTWRDRHGPELVNRFFDIVTVQKVTSKLLLDTLMLVLQTFIGLGVLAFYHPFLLGYDIGLLAIMTIVLFWIGRGAIKTAKSESQLKYETAAWLQEIVRHPTTYKFNNGLGFALNRADELAAEYINQRHGHFKILIRQFTFTMVMQVIAATVLLALGGYLVIIGELTLGQLVAAELIVTVILGSFAKFGKDLESFYDLMASVDKLGKLFDLPVEPVDKLTLTIDPGADRLSLVDAKLGAGFPTTNVEFSAGRSYAIYGARELDRSKLIEAFVGQSKLDSGHVLLNDFRVDTIAAESLQASVSLIRDIELFAGTIDQNLRMGREKIGSTEVNGIVNQLGFRNTLAGLDDGFNVLAPRDGTVFRLNVNEQGDTVKEGDSLLTIVPDFTEKAVEIFVAGNDMPLVQEGQEVRLQFEGWPAVQVAGWPSLAVGVFSGIVTNVDATDNGKGEFRILVTSNKDDRNTWPSDRYLRQGVRANGWVMLRRVSLGYEIWRQLNGFPVRTETLSTSILEVLLICLERCRNQKSLCDKRCFPKGGFKRRWLGDVPTREKRIRSAADGKGSWFDSGFRRTGPEIARR